MSWANSVLPVFMAASRQIPGRLPELAITIQIDTTLCSLEILVSHGFQRFNPSFNRTVVDLADIKGDGLLADFAEVRRDIEDDELAFAVGDMALRTHRATSLSGWVNRRA